MNGARAMATSFRDKRIWLGTILGGAISCWWSSQWTWIED
jgi:hypothetical protein